MKRFNKRLKDNIEGEELLDINPDNDSYIESNPKLNDIKLQKMHTLEFKIESSNKTNISNSGKWLKILAFVIILFFVILTLVHLIPYIKSLYKITPKVEKYNECQWFIDGKSYFEDLFLKLMEANNTIYIV